jgi:hypothetical protein
MKTLKERIVQNHGAKGLLPVPELGEYAEACDSYARSSLEDHEIQESLCRYLDTHAQRVKALSESLNRVKEPSISEVMTESVAMLVDSILRRKEFEHRSLCIFSEKNVKLPQGGYRKPDVGIWEGDQLLVAVECKTSLGRKRKEWLTDYNTRVEEFCSLGLRPSDVLLFVGTDQTWKGFPQGDSRISSVWFSLCQNGSWFGGGKTGELPLVKKQHRDVIKNFRSILFSTLHKKDKAHP